jgi:hypothetical protein
LSVHVISWVLHNSPVDVSGQRIVLIVLADHAASDGTGAYPSVETIAREARMSERNARYCLRALEERGAIVPEGLGPNGTTRYSVQMGGSPLPGANLAGGAKHNRKGRQPTAPEPTTNRPTTTAKDETATRDAVPRSAVGRAEAGSNHNNKAPESEDFKDWLNDHATITKRAPARAGTKARTALAEAFRSRRTEGYTLADLKLATRGAHHNDFRRENGYDRAESILRPTKVHDLVEDGRRHSGNGKRASDRWAAA